MQDKTINNALLALHKLGGDQAKVAAQLIHMRGVELPKRAYQVQPMKRGECRRLMLAELQFGPKTTSQLADAVQLVRPDITRRSANHRAYIALWRMKEIGLVVQDIGPDGCLWGLAQ